MFLNTCKCLLRHDPQQPEKVDKWLVLEQFVIWPPDDISEFGKVAQTQHFSWRYPPGQQPCADLLAKRTCMPFSPAQNCSYPSIALGPTVLTLSARPDGPKPDSRQDFGKGLGGEAEVYSIWSEKNILWWHWMHWIQRPKHTAKGAVSPYLFYSVILGTDLVQLAADLYCCYSAVFLNCGER